MSEANSRQGKTTLHVTIVLLTIFGKDFEMLYQLLIGAIISSFMHLDTASS